MGFWQGVKQMKLKKSQYRLSFIRIMNLLIFKNEIYDKQRLNKKAFLCIIN